MRNKQGGEEEEEEEEEEDARVSGKSEEFQCQPRLL